MAASAKAVVVNECGESADGRAAAQWTLADLGVSEELAEKLVVLRARGQDLNALLQNLLATMAGGEVVCEKPLVAPVERPDEKPTMSPVERPDEKLATEERLLQEKWPSKSEIA